MVTDVGTTTFTIDAGGVKKDVTIYALGFEDVTGRPGLAARAVPSSALADRLADFDPGGAIATDVRAADRYRGHPDGRRPAWPTRTSSPGRGRHRAVRLQPATDPNAFQIATRTLTPEEVAALGRRRVRGRVQSGLLISGPDDGKLYSFALRPLLPDETE